MEFSKNAGASDSTKLEPEELEELDELEPVVDDNKTRFSKAKKNLFVLIIALSVFLSPCSAQAFLPAASAIASDFKTTVIVIDLSIAIYTIVMAVSPCVATPLGDIYGRRPLFLICSLGFTISNVLVAVSRNLAMFFVFRCITAFFGTAFFSLGGAIVADIFIPAERGNAMGWTLLGSQLGPAFSPVVGGILVTYASWREIFWVLTGLGCITFILSFIYLEETGVNLKFKEMQLKTGKKFVWVPYNPFRVFVAFKYFNLIFSGLMSMALIYNMYVLMTPIPNVVDPRFNLSSPIDGALFYLAPGIGLLTGSVFGGTWADHYVRKYIEIRNGKRIPEDRLRSSYIPWLALPATIIIYGWCIDKEKGGMALPIIMMFLNGVAQTFCFPSLNAYCVDCLPHLGGDAIASNYFSRYIAGAVGAATCLVQIEHIGVGWSSTISAFVLLMGFASCLILIRFGNALRHREMCKQR